MFRQLFLIGAILTLLITYLAPARSSGSQMELPGPKVATGEPQHLFGVQMLGTISEDQGLSPAVSAGAQWVRFQLHWSNVERTEEPSPQYYWEFYDQAFLAAANAGLNLVVTVTSNPDWAGIAEPYTRCGPIHSNKIHRFYDFMEAAVLRYGVPPYNIKNWEFYNEPDNGDPWNFPNLYGCWGSPISNRDTLFYPERYANMLIGVSNRIKTVDPDVKIWMGGIAYDFFYDECDKQGKCGAFQPEWLKRVLAELKDKAGPNFPVFDVFNFHYYPAFRWRWEDMGKDIIGKTLWLKEGELGVEPYNIVSIPIAITEVGRPSAGPTEDGVIYSEERTARYVPKVFARSLAVGLSHVIWFTMIDNPGDPRKYGLLYADRSAKMAYEAYRTTIAEIGGASYLGRLQGNVDLEGYRFWQDGEEVWVVWRVDYVNYQEQVTSYPPTNVAIEANEVRVRNHLGNSVTYVSDGGPGDLDSAPGKIGLSVSEDPLFIQLNPPATPTPTMTPTATFTPTDTPSPTATHTPTATSVDIPLTGGGWNLIAIPLLPVNPAMGDVFSPISGSYDLVYAYNRCDPDDDWWKRYDPAAPSFVNDLTTASVTQGLWVRAGDDATLTVSGSYPGQTEIQLCPDWNLIGYPSEVPAPLPDALESIAGKYDLVYRYDADDEEDHWKKFDPNAPFFVNDLTQMEPGKGYWIRMIQEATLVVNEPAP